jgi:hypothetical protein
MKWRRVIFFANVVTIALFLSFMAMAFLWPEYLPYFNLSYSTCLLAIMHLISLMFLLAFFQHQLSVPWRIFCVLASFFILLEATLMLEIWR